MAEHSAADIGTAAGGDAEYNNRKGTYRGFVRLVKYAVAAIAIVLILMAIFLT